MTDDDGSLLVLDAGTGILRLGQNLPESLERIDILLTHLHLDHIQGLGFFAPLYRDDLEVHIWGPAGQTLDLRRRLTRYLSPPLFPVHLRSLPCELELHEMADEKAEIGAFRVTSALVCHPGSTLGYRVEDGDAAIAYLPDHEPALGVTGDRWTGEWTSGYELAHDTDLLIHDAQYTDSEYAERVGWGHSSWADAIRFATLAKTRHLVLFHHDPRHGDEEIERMLDGLDGRPGHPFELSVAREETTHRL